MLDLMLGLVLCVVGLERHAVVAHGLFSMSAESRVPLPFYFPALCVPVLINLRLDDTVNVGLGNDTLGPRLRSGVRPGRGARARSIDRLIREEQ